MGQVIQLGSSEVQWWSRLLVIECLKVEPEQVWEPEQGQVLAYQSPGVVACPRGLSVSVGAHKLVLATE